MRKIFADAKILSVRIGFSACKQMSVASLVIMSGLPLADLSCTRKLLRFDALLFYSVSKRVGYKK